MRAISAPLVVLLSVIAPALGQYHAEMCDMVEVIGPIIQVSTQCCIYVLDLCVCSKSLQLAELRLVGCVVVPGHARNRDCRLHKYPYSIAGR
jgi:hypothetical protein